MKSRKGFTPGQGQRKNWGGKDRFMKLGRMTPSVRAGLMIQRANGFGSSFIFNYDHLKTNFCFTKA
jgi:hypothetical protein